MTTTLTPPGPPSVSPGGRTAVRAALVIAAMAIIATAVALLTAAAWGLSSLRLVTDQENLPAAMRTLTVDTGGSPTAVRIVADREAATPRIDLRMVTTRRDDRDELAVTNRGGDTEIRLDAQPGMLPFGDPGQITITVPPDLGRRLAVTVRQHTGLLIADADLDRLTATNDDGAVLLNGALRRIEVRGNDSDVRARRAISVTESFSAETRDGDVQMRFAEVPPQIEAATRDGDIDILLPDPGPYLVRAQSGDGAVRVRVPQTTEPSRATATVTATTRDGAISVESLRVIDR